MLAPRPVKKSIQEALKTQAAARGLEAVSFAAEGASSQALPPAEKLLAQGNAGGAVRIVCARMRRGIACTVARASRDRVSSRAVAAPAKGLADLVAGTALLLDLSKPAETEDRLVLLVDVRGGKLPRQLLSSWRTELIRRGLRLVPEPAVRAARTVLRLPRRLEEDQVTQLVSAVGARGAFRLFFRARHDGMASCRTEISTSTGISGQFLQSKVEQIPRDVVKLFDLTALDMGKR